MHIARLLSFGSWLIQLNGARHVAWVRGWVWSLDIAIQWRMEHVLNRCLVSLSSRASHFCPVKLVEVGGKSLQNNGDIKTIGNLEFLSLTRLCSTLYLLLIGFKYCNNQPCLFILEFPPN